MLYFLFAIICFTSFCEIFDKRFGNFTHKSYFVFFLILFALATLRWERGTDWEAYYDYFSSIQKLDFSNNFEWGFVLLNYIVHVIFENYTALLCIQALIFYLCISKIIKKYSVYPLFSLLCFFAVTKGGIFFIRQHIAMAILMYAVKYIISSENKKFILFLVLAFCVHRTAIFFLPVVFLWKVKVNFRYYILGLAIIIVFSFMLETLLSSFFGNIGGLIGYMINNYINLTSSGEDYGVELSHQVILIRGIIKRTVIIFLYFFYMCPVLDKNPLVRGFFNVYMYGVFLYILLAPLSEQLARVCLYFDLFDIFLFAYLLYFQKNVKNKLIIFFFVTFVSLGRLYSGIEIRKELYIPYKSIFNKELPVEAY